MTRAPMTNKPGAKSKAKSASCQTRPGDLRGHFMLEMPPRGQRDSALRDLPAGLRAKIRVCPSQCCGFVTRSLSWERAGGGSHAPGAPGELCIHSIWVCPSPWVKGWGSSCHLSHQVLLPGTAARGGNVLGRAGLQQVKSLRN